MADGKLPPIPGTIEPLGHEINGSYPEEVKKTEENTIIEHLEVVHIRNPPALDLALEGLKRMGFAKGL